MTAKPKIKVNPKDIPSLMETTEVYNLGIPGIPVPKSKVPSYAPVDEPCNAGEVDLTRMDSGLYALDMRDRYE